MYSRGTVTVKKSGCVEQRTRGVEKGWMTAVEAPEAISDAEPF